MIVFHTKHDYDEVPLYPAAWRETVSNRPEEMFEGPLEGAYAKVPLLNQLPALFPSVIRLFGENSWPVACACCPARDDC